MEVFMNFSVNFLTTERCNQTANYSILLGRRTQRANNNHPEASKELSINTLVNRLGNKSNKLIIVIFNNYCNLAT